MTSITTRAGKGTPLTHTEVDDNFTNLNADKLEASNNLSDVSSASAARTNLGLGTAATTASTDYATAAQGSLADSALQPGDNISALTNDAGYTTNVGDITGVTAGSGITGGGTSGTVTISHADTSSQGSVNNSGATVIQDITLDTYGHITALGSTTLSIPAAYTNSDVDTHLNTSTATANQVLSWTGSDYDWVAQSGGTGGGGIEFTVKTTTYTASANEGIIADTSGGAWTLTLPATPSAGDVVVVADGADWGTNNLTVARNGSTIEGAAEDLTMDIGNVSVTMLYDGSTWQVYAQAGASESTAITASSTDTLTNKTISGAANTITADGTNPVGYLNLPPVGTKTASYTLQTADVGKYVQVGTGGSITIPNSTFAEGDAVSLFNNTSGDVTVTCSISTAYVAGANSDVASATLATRGVANVLFISPTVCVITGNVS